MVFLTKSKILEISNLTNFKKEQLEKVLRLYNVLTFIFSNEEINYMLALKGGTAINFTTLELTRLSVDIDLDFTINCVREEMFEKRELISNILKEYMFNNGYSMTKSSKKTHALDSFEFSYQNNFNNKDSLKIEINYLSRTHVLDVTKVITKLPFLPNKEIVILNKYELFASKMKALIERCTIRDVYDVYQMLDKNIFNNTELTLIKKILMYYVIIGKDSNESIGNIIIEFNKKIDTYSLKYIPQYLSSTLRKSDAFNLIEAVETVKNFINNFITLDENEVLFSKEFENGNYKPELLFNDIEIINRIKNHPMALWKLKNK